ncbi:lipocalin family protein [Deinococcus ficus]|uniref:Carotenoid 1,2-hydratase n=1 Tax=Deinococcus ficus TaxID=317577 RepID=A0A221SXD2_9DEIO|nr:lipocalin family protein [Deinococcus ficus]ASN81305.1 carotenoid 1,2-hydratase [Deinococcus ficus]
MRLIPTLRLLPLALLLAACAPVIESNLDTARLPAATEFGPHNHRLEWWYLSSALPEEGLAFHWAIFRVLSPDLPVPGFFSNVMVTDLKTGQVTFQELKPGLGTASFPPLNLGHGGWTLTQDTVNAPFKLEAGPLKLRLTPAKAPMIHPPGFSGAPETGFMAYQGITRLNFTGEVAGRPVQGQAWFDHQWGTQVPGRSGVWDWFSIQLDNGQDVMVYRTRTPDGRVVQVIASIVDAQGVARAATNVTLEPAAEWTGRTGYRYPQSWRLKADEFDLTVQAVRAEQELLSQTTRIAYWEGAVQVTGTFQGGLAAGQGMMEIVGGTLP